MPYRLIDQVLGPLVAHTLETNLKRLLESFPATVRSELEASTQVHMKWAELTFAERIFAHNHWSLVDSSAPNDWTLWEYLSHDGAARNLAETPDPQQYLSSFRIRTSEGRSASLANFYDNRVPGVCKGVIAHDFWEVCCTHLTQPIDLCFVCYICGIPGGIVFKGAMCLAETFQLYGHKALPRKSFARGASQ